MRALALRLRRCALVAAAAALAPLAPLAAPVTVTVTDGADKPLADAIVTLHVKGARTTAPAGTMAQIGQKERQFLPQVSVFQTGTAVLFPNFDTVRHHVYSFSPIQKFELKLYAGTPTAPVLFDKPGTAVLGCNIHDRMNAWVYVVDTPYFAKTDAAGRATLDVPAGDAQLRVWHHLQPEPVQPLDRALKVAAAGMQTTAKLALAPQ